MRRPGYARRMPQLVLLRHGQSQWNAENLFTGWHDVDLTEQGEDEAREAGRLLAAEAEPRPAGTPYVAADPGHPHRRPSPWKWPSGAGCRCGATGGSTSGTTATSRGGTRRRRPRQHGEAQVKEWRRSYATPPPAVAPGQRARPGRRPPLPGHPGRRPAPHRVPGRRGGPRPPLLGRRHRARPAGRRGEGWRRAGGGPRQQPAGSAQAHRRHRRRRDRRASRSPRASRSATCWRTTCPSCRAGTWATRKRPAPRPWP